MTTSRKNFILKKRKHYRYLLIDAEDREENGYPPRSHDCQAAEIEFADDYELSQQVVERREENLQKKRMMVMWKNSLVHVSENRPIEATLKLIHRVPEIMKAIIDADGGKISY